MGKADVIKRWKPELKKLGFVYRRSMFLYRKTEDQAIQFGVSIQRSIHEARFKVHVTIILKNPLIDRPELEVLLGGNISREGARVHETNSTWWPENELGEALMFVKVHAMHWFDEHRVIQHLVDLFEEAISQRIGPEYVLQPIDESKYPAWYREWHPPVDTAERRVGPLYLYQTAVLHYLNGDHANAIARTKDWMEVIGPSDTVWRAKAENQLATLTKATRLN
jgi:hypothetical protein